jgi:hypothetical protein
MEFSTALVLLRAGHTLRRAKWVNIKSVKLQPAAGDSDSYLYAITDQGKRAPWLASQADMLSEDWELLDGFAKPPGSPQKRTTPAVKALGASEDSEGSTADPEAPYGRKADGTPKRRPGRRSVQI